MKVGDDVLDSGLSYAKTNARYIHICSQEPANYTEASSTYTLGNKDLTAGGVFPGAIAAGSPNGRKLASATVSDGSVTGTNTATHFAVVTGTVFICTQSLNSSQAVTSGNTFSLTSFDLRLPGA